jgi:hypothetical protein
MEALSDIKKNVFGEGIAAPVVANSNNPATAAATKADDGRGQLLGSVGGLKHYLVATFGANVHLNLDDDNKTKAPGDANWSLGDIESKFHMVSTVESDLTGYENALAAYSSELQKHPSSEVADANAQLVKEQQLAMELRKALVQWKKWAEDAQSFFTSKATAQGYAKQMSAQIEPFWSRLQTFGKLPLPVARPAPGPKPAVAHA